MPILYPLRVPPWIIELLNQWSTLDMPKFGPPAGVSEEMLALLLELQALEEACDPRFIAIRAHFKPWIDVGRNVHAETLFVALIDLANRVDAELEG